MNLNQLVNIDRYTGLPRAEINDSNSTLLFPFYVSSGANKYITNIASFRRIFEGNSAVILRGEGAESYLKPNDADVATATHLVREINVDNGVQIKTKMLSNNFETKFMSNTMLSATEQTLVKTMQLYTNSSFIYDLESSSVNNYYLYFFYLIPELGEDDMFFITQCQVFLDQDGNYHHTELTFKSVTDELRASGMALEQFINYGAPGEGFAYPVVKKVYKEVNTTAKVDENGNVVTDSKGNPIYEKGTRLVKSVKLNPEKLKNQPITSCQIEFIGSVGLSSVGFIGRPNDSEKPLEIQEPRQLLISDMLSPKSTYISSLLPKVNNDYVLVEKCALESQIWFSTGKEKLEAYADPGKNRENRGMLVLESDAIATNPKVPLIDPKYKPNQTMKDQVQGKNIFDKNYEFDMNIPSRMGMSKYSDQQYANELKYTQDSSGNKTGLSADNKTKYATGAKANFIDFLNFNHYNNEINAPELMPRLASYTNNNSRNGAIIDTVLGVGGAVIGGLTGGSFGAVAGSYIGSLLGKAKEFVPGSGGRNKTIYYGTNEFSMILPRQFYELAKEAITGEAKGQSIPVNCFLPNESNDLANLISTDQYSSVFHFQLSDQLAKGNNTLDIGKGKYRVNGINDLSAITPQSSNTKGYALDAISIKALGAKPFVLTFYSNDKAVGQGTYKSTALYTDNVKKGDTTILLSDYNDDGYATRLDAGKSTLTEKLPPKIINVENNQTAQQLKKVQDELAKVPNTHTITWNTPAEEKAYGLSIEYPKGVDTFIDEKTFSKSIDYSGAPNGQDMYGKTGTLTHTGNLTIGNHGTYASKNITFTFNTANGKPFDEVPNLTINTRKDLLLGERGIKNVPFSYETSEGVFFIDLPRTHADYIKGGTKKLEIGIGASGQIRTVDKSLERFDVVDYAGDATLNRSRLLDIYHAETTGKSGTYSYDGTASGCYETGLNPIKYLADFRLNNSSLKYVDISRIDTWQTFDYDNSGFSDNLTMGKGKIDGSGGAGEGDMTVGSETLRNALLNSTKPVSKIHLKVGKVNDNRLRIAYKFEIKHTEKLIPNNSEILVPITTAYYDKVIPYVRDTDSGGVQYIHRNGNFAKLNSAFSVVFRQIKK